MKRLSLIMMCLLALMAASLSAKAQEVTITLYPGCNWISYPNSEMLDINTALGDFVPVDGDIIQSQVNYSVYVDGQWRGSVTHFMPGWGYKYYSNRTETVSFTFSHTGTLPTVTTADPTGITLSGFTGGGEVVNTGNSVITVYGLCWGTNPNPTVNDFQAVAGYGTGTFTWEVGFLEMNTTYYVRAYVLTEKGMVYGDQKVFSTLTGIPVVSTAEVTEINMSSATFGGTVSDDGGITVTERGVCWSTSPNPTLESDHVANGEGLGDFTVDIDNLQPSTTYYVRAYASNSNTTSYGDEVSFTTLALPTYTIAVMANPAEGGIVAGGDVIELGQSCTVTATPNTGYDFVNWTENGVQVSTDPSYTFTVSGDRNLVANFQIQSFTIAASVNPEEGGAVAGAGTYDYGTSCTLTATPATGYDFVNWTENGNLVSDDPNYTFIVTGERNLVAHFQLQSFAIAASANPTEGGSVAGTGTYNYGTSCTLTATPATGYDFVNWTENGTPVSTSASYTFTVSEARTLVANFQLQSFAIAASADPAEGGTIEGAGAGTYNYGTSCTLTATPATGYDFVNWTENGTPVSTNASYTFTVSEARTLVANFQLQSFTITASTDPAGGGTIEGAGTYNYGQSCTLTVIPNGGYSFTNWTENGEVVSTDASYTFTVNGNRNVVANFIQGIIDGVFSVSATQQVYFSQGNLQYRASTNTWQFAEHQYDFVGPGNENISETYDGWIDLFGWGTSGYNHGANCYQPWSTSTTNSNYYAYGSYHYKLYDQTGQADWGYNAISNGGNNENSGWRTLTRAEWTYLCRDRITPSGIRFAKATVNGVNGTILLPDNWSDATYPLNYPNESWPNYTNNIITAANWANVLEANGAVFLPVAGKRNGTTISTSTGSFYWTSFCDNEPSALYLMAGSGSCGYGYRYNGCSVRLVRNVE